MKRRHFLQVSLIAPSLIGEVQKPSPIRSKKGFKIDDNKDRFDKEIAFLGGRFLCKVSAKDTNGDLCIYDTFRMQKGGLPLHYHHSQDEWFYVMEGEFLIKVGEDTFHLKPGDSAFGPRKVPHTFANVSKGTGRIMIVFQPAGTMEAFFEEASKLTNPTPEALQKISHAHGSEIIGPPLDINK